VWQRRLKNWTKGPEHVRIEGGVFKSQTDDDFHWGRNRQSGGGPAEKAVMGRRKKSKRGFEGIAKSGCGRGRQGGRAGGGGKQQILPNQRGIRVMGFLQRVNEKKIKKYPVKKDKNL